MPWKQAKNMYSTLSTGIISVDCAPFVRNMSASRRRLRRLYRTRWCGYGKTAVVLWKSLHWKRFSLLLSKTKLWTVFPISRSDEKYIRRLQKNSRKNSTILTFIWKMSCSAFMRMLWNSFPKIIGKHTKWIVITGWPIKKLQKSWTSLPKPLTIVSDRL